MASSVFFAGTVTNRPSSLTEQDASALEAASVAATGIVLLIGEGIGGPPVSALDGDPANLPQFRSSAKALKMFRGGDLREAINLCFNPGNDPQIPNGPSQVWALKVNPSTQSVAPVPGLRGAVADILSADYGAHTEQVRLSIASGSAQGLLTTVQFEALAQGEDNIGGSDLFTLRYTEPPATGWDTMSAAKRSGGLEAWGGRVETGLDGQVTLAAVASLALTVAATAGDVGRTLTVYGLDVGGAVQVETFTLVNGTLTGSRLWSQVYGATLQTPAGALVVAAGTITIADTSPATHITLTAGQSTRGVVVGQGMFVAGQPIQLYAAGATTANVIVVGRNAQNALAQEVIALAGTVAVQTATSWNRIDYLIFGGVAAASSITVSARSIVTVDAAGGQETLLQLAEFVNARSVVVGGTRYGFLLTLATSRTSTRVENLDLTDSSVAIQAAPAGFRADLYAWLTFLNERTTLVEATRVPFTGLAYDVTIAPVASTVYTWSLDGIVLTVTSPAGTPTAADIAALMAARVLRDPRVSRAWNAAVLGTGQLRVSARAPIGGTYTDADANLSSVLANGTLGPGSAPSLTATPIYLAGGIEGTTTVQDWIDAFVFAEQLRPNKIVPLSDDPAVHALFDAHLDRMSGPGRHEREGAVGLASGSGGLPSLTDIRDQVASLNNRNLQAVGQEFDQFATNNVLRVFGPRFLAVVLMGAKAGAGIGGSLTGRYLNLRGLRSHSSWNPREDGETLIDYGACILEGIQGRGYRVVRNVTTYLTSDSFVYSEAHVNEAANYATLTVREGMEYLIGRKGFVYTRANAVGTLEGYLGNLQRDEVLADWGKLGADLSADVLELSAEISPVISINFVLTTLHLVLARQAA